MANGCINKSGDYIVRSPVPDAIIPNDSVPELIWKNMEKYADYPALTCGVRGRSYTFKEARDLSRRFGAALLEKGFQPGDVLAVMSHNMPEYPLIMLGALEAGLIATTINSTCKKNEILHALRTTGAKIMSTLPSLVPLVKGVLELLKSEIPIITVSYDEPKLIDEELCDFEDMISGNAELESNRKAQPDDIAFLLSTSGTTGASKFVTWTHGNVVAYLAKKRVLYANQNGVNNSNQKTTSGDQNVVLVTLLAGHAHMMNAVLEGLAQNAHIITLPKWEPQNYLRVLSSQKPLTVDLLCNPGIMSCVQSIAKTEDLKSVRLIANRSDYLVPSFVKNLLCKLPNREDVTFINVYGSTETMGICAVAIDPTRSNPEMIGFLGSNTQVRIVSSSGKDLGPGEAGEMYVKGPQVTKGYFNNNKANAEAFDKDGWFKSGDLAYYDENNRIYLKGRLKDIIKVKSFPVSPAELEGVLLQHPCVAEAAVTGTPAEEGVGETPIAFVVPKLGADLDYDAVLEFVAEQVAPIKRLSKIILKDSLPRNANGKVRKNILREEYLKTV